MNCCNQDCAQGRLCPVRAFYTENAEHFKEPAPTPVAPVERACSDIKDKVLHSLQWTLIAIVAVCALAAIVGFTN